MSLQASPFLLTLEFTEGNLITNITPKIGNLKNYKIALNSLTIKNTTEKSAGAPKKLPKASDVLPVKDNKTTTVLVYCDLVSNSYSNTNNASKLLLASAKGTTLATEEQILFTFEWNGENQNIVPNNHIFLPIILEDINRIYIKLLDASLAAGNNITGNILNNVSGIISLYLCPIK